MARPAMSVSPPDAFRRLSSGRTSEQILPSSPRSSIFTRAAGLTLISSMGERLSSGIARLSSSPASSREPSLHGLDGAEGPTRGSQILRAASSDRSGGRLPSVDVSGRRSMTSRAQRADEENKRADEENKLGSPPAAEGSPQFGPRSRFFRSSDGTVFPDTPSGRRMQRSRSSGKPREAKDPDAAKDTSGPRNAALCRDFASHAVDHLLQTSKNFLRTSSDRRRSVSERLG
ncbi:hypothetical protein T484DRAFT_1937057 [Baffinella frigidus]|nr:hypothetical protein T484DRAFT_1937057 [Cryptophyta sp. CCMP2293]